MKIGELFIALGFKVDSEPLDETERRMEGAAIKAGKLALVVNAVNVAMLAMVDSAMKAAVSLRLWEQTTGGSTDELQRWGQAARIAGIGADDLRKAVDSLQDARNSFALGEPQNVGAWSLLGVDPTQDPFAVLSKLRARLAQTRDPNLMRGLLGKVGMAGVMPLLQLPPSEFARLQNTILSRPQIDRLVALNREWQRLLVSLGAVKNQLAAGLAPALRVLATVLGAVATGLNLLTNWLNSSGTAAMVARIALGLLAVAFLALGAAIAVVAAGFAALAAALVIFSPAVLAVAAATAPLLATLALIGAGVAALVLLLDDFWTAADGGEHVFDWSLSLKAVDLMAKGLERLVWLFGKLGELRQWGEDRFASFFQRWGVDAWQQRPEDALSANKGAAWFAPRTGGGASATWTQENNVEIKVDGARDPNATAGAVNRSLRSELESAARQMPVPNY